ncbi:MAG: hypothetical protein ACT4OM_08460 [Actinomycetota bacterium]
MPELQRVTRWAGLGAMLCLLVSGFFGKIAGGPPPPFASSPEALVGYYLRYADSTVISALLSMIGVALLAIFAAGLWERFCNDARARVWGLVGLIGIGTFSAVSAVVAMTQMALAGLARLERPPVAGVQLGVELWAAGLAATGVAAAPLLAGFGMAGLAAPAGQVHARWLAWVGLVGAGAGVARAMPDAVAAVSTVAADLFGLIGELQLPLLYLWLTGVSLALGRRPRCASVEAAHSQNC